MNPVKNKKQMERKNQLPASTEIQTSSVMVIPKIDALEKFMLRMNQKPESNEVKTNKMANNSNYIPISFITNKLDELFIGLWNFEMLREQVIANEIIGVGVLEVFHPVANVWIRRSGSAAVMIQQRSKENGGSGQITNIGDKIKNTLVKDFPHLEAECLKSAAKKLGKMFGRDLNREFEDIYSPIYSESEAGNDNFTVAIEEMKKATTDEQFKVIWDTFTNLQGNQEFQKNYMYYKRKNVKLKK